MTNKQVLPAYRITAKSRLSFADRVLIALFKLATRLDELGEAILEERFRRAVSKAEKQNERKA